MGNTLNSISIWKRIRYRWLNFRKWMFCPLFSKLNWVWGYKKWDCKRYEPKPEPVWVWLCPVCRKRVPEGYLNAIYQKFEPGQEPTEACDCPTTIPIDMVKREVCIRSGDLKGKFCISFETREFEKGTQPTEKCKIHDYVKSGRREEMCGGTLGFFMSFMRQAWKKKNQLKAEEDVVEVLAEMAKRDIKYMDFFMWLCDNKFEHKPVNDKTPYRQFKNKLGKRMFDLDDWDERYWELFDRFIYMCSKFGIIPIPQLFMARYCDYPFQNNINGVRGGVLDPSAIPYECALGDRTFEILKKYFNETMCKFVNEAMHGGSDSAFHQIADWHRDMFWGFMRRHFDTKEKALGSLVIDQSLSEAGQGHLAWHSGEQVCPKCHTYRWDSQEWMDRLRIGETHGCSTIEGFYSGHKDLSKFWTSANRRSRWHEDGGASCLGHGFKAQWSKVCFANAEEYGIACDHVWEMQVTRGRGKKAYMCIFPCETLEYIDGVFYVTYKVSTVDWTRFDAMLTAHIKHFGV